MVNVVEMIDWMEVGYLLRFLCCVYIVAYYALRAFQWFVGYLFEE